MSLYRPLGGVLGMADCGRAGDRVMMSCLLLWWTREKIFCGYCVGKAPYLYVCCQIRLLHCIMYLVATWTTCDVFRSATSKNTRNSHAQGTTRLPLFNKTTQITDYKHLTLLGGWTALVGGILWTCKGNVLVSRCKQTNKRTMPTTDSELLQTWIEPWRKLKIPHRKTWLRLAPPLSRSKPVPWVDSSSSVLSHWYNGSRSVQQIYGSVVRFYKKGDNKSVLKWSHSVRKLSEVKLHES
jgi:hypothetical protein